VRLFRLATAIDAWLLAAPSRARAIVIALTLVVITATAATHVPRPFLDYSRWPILAGIPQPDRFGTDTIADAYEARVIRHDVADMYTKRGVEQTPEEAATWSKEASSPYPPATLLVLAALSAAGDAAGIGLYGAVSCLAILFLGLSLAYCLRTRWYLFPLLYLNFGYVGERFFAVQDGSYLVMLTMVMAALFAARRRPAAAHTAMAMATVMKLSPLYHARLLRAMPRRIAALFVAILVAGFIAPYFIWDNYLYIFKYNSELKGDSLAAAGALALAVPFTMLLAWVEAKRGFDLEEAIGWSLVPVALFLAFKMNAARHLLLVLLVPDKRGIRNVAVAAGLAAHALAPSLVPINATLPMATLILIVGLTGYLRSGRPA
jgi:hypothetical protein